MYKQRHTQAFDRHLTVFSSVCGSGCLGCTVMASWQAMLCGTWWWCICSRGSTLLLCPTCWSSTTAWRTPPSLCSTCCWPSAQWPPSTGKDPPYEDRNGHGFCVLLCFLTVFSCRQSEFGQRLHGSAGVHHIGSGGTRLFL